MRMTCGTILAAAAVAWTLRHIGEYGGDSNKVFVSGMSAGGYLTMMVGMDSKWLAAHGVRNGWGQTPRNARFTGLSAISTL